MPPPSPLLFRRIYNGTLQNRLIFGKTLYGDGTLGRRLMQETAFAEAFAALRHAGDTLARNMDGKGMGLQCAACSANNPGGCCSREMAEEADTLQMLMNLLAGVEVEIREGNGGACCFLGSGGCIFKFKPMFCLNYNCDKIIAQIGSSRSELELLTGRLLGCQYQVEQLLLARIGNI